MHPADRKPTGDVGVSADQLAARQIGQDTSLPSLELCGEPGGYSSVSYRTPLQQAPMEGNPRKVFYGMFGQGDSNEERRAIIASQGSLLDYAQRGRPRASAASSMPATARSSATTWTRCARSSAASRS